MSSEDGVRYLDTSLLGDTNKLIEISHWLDVIKRSNGWHYDLDLIWILKSIEEMELEPGSTILDAGAGLGIAQFLLAARGFNVLSLDYCAREVPANAQEFFDISVIDNDLGQLHHSYMDYILHQPKLNVVKSVFRSLRYKGLLLDKLLNKMNHISALNRQRTVPASGYGRITFVKGSFNDIPLDSSSIDVVISVSAFEHNDYESMPISISEFERVLRDKGKMFITTSAAETEDWYYQNAQGWCLTNKTLSKWFDVPQIDESGLSFGEILHRLKCSRIIKKRISSAYKYDRKSSVPLGDLSKVPYIPVGVLKTKTVSA